jgi:hypothetical protein
VFVFQGELDQFHGFLIVIHEKDFIVHRSAPDVRACFL